MIPPMRNLEKVDDVPSPNPDRDAECLCCNGKDQHTEPILLTMCTVRLVDFRKIQHLSAKIISDKNLHTKGNNDKDDPNDIITI